MVITQGKKKPLTPFIFVCMELFLLLDQPERGGDWIREGSGGSEVGDDRDRPVKYK